MFRLTHPTFSRYYTMDNRANGANPVKKTRIAQIEAKGIPIGKFIK